MEYKNTNNRESNGNQKKELLHNIPINEGTAISTKRGSKYINYEKAVTIPTPSSDKVDD